MFVWSKLRQLFIDYKRLIFVLLVSWMALFVVGGGALLASSLRQLGSDLEDKISHIRADVQFVDDAWDLTLYNSDPKLLGTYPLYFIALDGFVLDRRSPVRGFLDIADYKRLLSYTTPQTLKSVSGQLRRVYARPITDQSKIVGVIAVSYFNPTDLALEKIDSKLTQTADDIMTKVTVENGQINTSQLDLRKIPYDISFTVVDAYNSILTKTANVNNIDRIPNFIDPSYVKNTITSRPVQIIRDSQTGEYFLMRISPFLKDSQLLAIIAVGASIEPVLQTLKDFMLLDGVASLLVTAGVFVALVFGNKNADSEQQLISKVTREVSFDEKRGRLVIDGHAMDISYATNQYYLLKALFSKSSKRWETDELLDRFGVDSTPENGRKVYDAMININKKVAKKLPTKLIINQNKTYQLNQELFISS